MIYRTPYARLLVLLLVATASITIALVPVYGQDSLLVVREGTGKRMRSGVYDLNGRLVVPIVPATIRTVTAPGWNLFSFSIDGEEVLLRWSGDPFIEGTVEDFLSPYGDSNRIAVLLEGKWGYYDRDGRLVIPHRYDWATSFEDGMAWVASNGDTIAIDCDGRLIPSRKWQTEPMEIAGISQMSLATPLPAERIFSDCRVESADSLLGVRSTSGEWLIEPEYRAFKDRVGDVFILMKDGRWGAISIDGSLIVPFTFDEIYSVPR